MDHKTWSIDKAKTLVGINPIGNDILDIVLAYLSLNTEQKLIVRKIMHHIMYNQATFQLEQSN